MTNQKKSPSYFPFAIQIGIRHWQELVLHDVARPVQAGQFPTIYFYRALADRLSRQTGRPVQAGQLALYSLLTRIYRHLLARYLAEQQPQLLPAAMENCGFPLDSTELTTLLETFSDHFPPDAILSGQVAAPAAYYAADDATGSRRREAACELLLLRLAAENRAVEPFRPLLDDRSLAAASPYLTFVAGLERELAAAPPVAAFGVPLPELLRAPLRAAPDSLYDQLAFIRAQWRGILPEELLLEIATAFVVVHEESRLFAPRGEPGGAPVLQFRAGADDHYPEYERFSFDTDWMANVVLIAKMVYVWLGQLSRQYCREITRLDQIPDTELDRLARRGFTGLWLIGLWERSEASRKIKHLTGNPDAIASAYSLFDYQVAADLGGWEALHDLKERALRRSIRLASDMVPNHTGIYSRWMVEHPHWFIQQDYPPYPAYRYTGPDLSASPEVSIHLEDGYWDRTDAAVVFKLFDHRDGRERYIYHGNDGTSTPWNDTAQLNYLLPEVREAVIQTILHVARNFPIIRFDAAMTLAKRHYQRLWFPQPGHSGVPSRAEQGLTRQQFDAAMPEEFWRQVVDRVAAEVPDTLLLAEAFWLMEGYFVRTLGMHRVYNSAFMNMLKMEENAKYRQTVKNVLEFDPRVLQRFVNFMNNPDERTAVEQFGKEGKYFGACVLLATMPGLPMFGHGQVEGFHEKYGMEYQRANWEEPADEHLVREHERRIFPLLRRRWLFSGADNFVLYDFWAGGTVNEDVFAYSNRAGDHCGLVVFHNRFGDTAGWIRSSTARVVRNADGGMELRQSSLGEALGCKGDGRHYYVFRDYAMGLEYIRNGRELCDRGLYVELGGYESHVFLDFREIWDDEFGTWGTLCHRLDGRPVPSVDEEVKQVRFAGLIDRFRQLLHRFDGLLAGDFGTLDVKSLNKVRLEFHDELCNCLTGLAGQAGLTADPFPLAKQIMKELASLENEVTGESPLLSGPTARRIMFAWLCLHRIGQLVEGDNWPEQGAVLVHAYGLARPLQELLYAESTVADDPLAGMDVLSLVELFLALLRWQGFLALPAQERATLLPELLNDRPVALFIGRHESGDYEWLAKERWELLLQWLAEAALTVAVGESRTGTSATPRRAAIELASAELAAQAATAGYRLDLLAGTEPPGG